MAAADPPQPHRWRMLDGVEYQLADIFVISAERAAAIRATAARAWNIVRAIAPIARALSDDALAMFGIPPAARDIVRTLDPAAPETLVGRFDLIETPSGFRVIELNAETPFFLVETHCVSGALARERGFIDPNAGCADALGRAIARAIGAAGNATHVTVVAHDNVAEDRATADYLRDRIAESSPARVTYAPLSSLRVRTDGLYGPAGRIDVLYRLSPLEFLARDRPAAQLFALVERGALRLLNPASALVAQSKMLFVLIWGLAQRDDILSPAQRTTVADIFLPTFADLPVDGCTYISKCVLGREGASTAIVRPDGTVTQSRVSRYGDQPRVYQRHVEMPQWTAHTPSGRLVDGRVLTTCFIVAGEPGAIGVRVGGEITDDRAYYAAVGIPRPKQLGK